MKKRTLFSKIPAVSAHESERVSWASQLSLQTLVKPRSCNLFLSYCCLMLSSNRRFSNPAFQNLCSNPYFWGVKTRVSKFGFKTDIENPKLEKLNFWSTLIGPLLKPFCVDV